METAAEGARRTSATRGSPSIQKKKRVGGPARPQRPRPQRSWHRTLRPAPMPTPLQHHGQRGRARTRGHGPRGPRGHGATGRSLPTRCADPFRSRPRTRAQCLRTAVTSPASRESPPRALRPPQSPSPPGNGVPPVPLATASPSPPVPQSPGQRRPPVPCTLAAASPVTQSPQSRCTLASGSP